MDHQTYILYTFLFNIFSIFFIHEATHVSIVIAFHVLVVIKRLLMPRLLIRYLTQ